MFVTINIENNFMSIHLGNFYLYNGPSIPWKDMQLFEDKEQIMKILMDFSISET